MNKMRFHFYLLILFFSLIATKSLAIPRCEELFKAVYNDEIRKDVNIASVEDQKTIGIRLEKYWDTNEIKRGKWELKTNQNGYFIVGKVTKGSLSNQIMSGDIILSINDIDLRNLVKDKKNKKIMKKDISDLFEKDELIKFKILRKDKTTKKEEIIIVDRKYKKSKKSDIKNFIESFSEPRVDFYVSSIEVNEKKGFFDASIETRFLEIIDERYFLTKAIFDTIVYDKVYDDKSRLIDFWYERCTFPDEEWHKLNSVDPYYGMRFDNLIKEDLTARTSLYHIEPHWTTHFIKDENSEKVKDKNTPGYQMSENEVLDNVSEVDWSKIYFKPDRAKIIYKSISSYRIKNNFNLKSFPFDKQKLTIYLKNDIFDIKHYRSLITADTMRKALEFKNLNSIQGWNITNVVPEYHISFDENTRSYYDGFRLEFDIERKSGYYIFKIIFPIVLILSICWSSIWIHPKEIESRLTITIVCLLSLIAYNFVIDTDLPKLEYLTIMDYIILISYIYAAIPNFLSINSFRLWKNKKSLLIKRNEFLEKKLGLLSYVMVIFIIIFYNSATNKNHTGAFLSLLTQN